MEVRRAENDAVDDVPGFVAGVGALGAEAGRLPALTRTSPERRV